MRGGKGILPIAVVLNLPLFLSGCLTTSCDCPAWPKAGPEVAKELERTLKENGQPKSEWEHTWNWLQRLDKLEKQLKVCNE